MNLDEAKELLSNAKRSELRDHSFGDREVYWNDENNDEIANGYFGRGVAEVTVQTNRLIVMFFGNDAKELVLCGNDNHIDRNDTTGPDEYLGP